MELHNSDRNALDRAVSQLQDAFGDGLLGVSLTGEAASDAYRPGESPLSLAVVLDRVSPAALRTIRPMLDSWASVRIGTPLLMDPAYMDDSLDVFPLEFLDLGDRHLVLHGPTDLFADMPLNREHLRLEVEEQIKGKLLHLRAAYLEHGTSTDNVRGILLGTLPSFERILRGICALTDRDRPAAAGDLFGAVSAASGVTLDAFRRIHGARIGEGEIQSDQCDAVFDDYVAEVAALATWTNGLR